MIQREGNHLFLEGPVVMDTVPDLVNSTSFSSLGPEVTIDFSRTTTLDSAAVALLLHWLREAARGKKKLVFVKIPDNLHVLISLYGLSPLLEGIVEV
ncbi:STAS domain-containing protein [Ferrovum myxofaciens]|uniref:Anti-sigma-factor antagonist n=1 Tax=mine drainage metagenome TaxID=410659 RepID=T1BXQ4_9ZZZZ|nr:STAS domain-containing protein [Ferrovum myxofaciens]MBU6994809.1 STAS domain-containing protein [Ferrovum myxofaciens]QKE41187.1 MAG: STAS domain-containing protein [Ferrovum myxofaciens]